MPIYYWLANLGFHENIKLENLKIERVRAAKSLGVIIDEELSWDSHIDYVAKKVSAAIGGMKLVRPSVNREILLIYNALVQPFFDYCDVVWDSLSAGLATRLQRLQNRAGRIILRANYETRSEEVLKTLEWENLSARRMKHKAIAMYKVLYENAPKYLKDDI